MEEGGILSRRYLGSCYGFLTNTRSIGLFPAGKSVHKTDGLIKFLIIKPYAGVTALVVTVELES